MDAAIEAAESVRDRYEAVWSELHDQPELIPGDRQAIRARLRRLNDLGFSVDLEVDPVGPHGSVRLRTSVTTRRYHANELERRTRLRALEGQARILLNDLAEYQAWLEFYERRLDRGRGGRRPLAARGLPADAGADRRRSSAAIGTSSRPTATCSSTSGCCPSRPDRDVGLDAAIESYLAEGAPAPERPGPGDARRRGRPTLDGLDLAADDEPRPAAELSAPSAPGGRARRAAAGRRAVAAP